MKIFCFVLITSCSLAISSVSKADASFSPTKVTEKVGLSAIDFTSRVAYTKEIIYKYSNGNQEVLNTSNRFLSHLCDSYRAGEGMIDKDIYRILDAMEFAAFKHQYQARKNQQATPYIIHPIGVADYLLTIGEVRDPDILIGALLHDTVEDTNTSFEEICDLFGPRVEGFVREVTDDKSLSRKERKALQIAHAPDKSAGAAQIKLADKLYNLNDVQHAPPAGWGKKEADEYYNWSDKVVHALPWVNAALLKAVDQTITDYRSL